MLIGIIIGTAGILCSIFFIPPLHDSVFSQTSNIANFYYKNTDYYNFAKGVLVNLDHGGGYVYPNDRLVYDVILLMKKPDLVNMTATISYSVGDKTVNTQKFGKLLLGTHEGGFVELRYPLSAQEEGVSHIQLHTDFFNKNGTYLDSNDEVTSFQVFSLASKLQVEQNNYTLDGIISTSVVSSMAVLFTGIQILQNRNEKKQTIRPWISKTLGLTITTYYNDAGNSRTLKEWESMSNADKIEFNPTKVQWKIPLKNFGSVPAIDVEGHTVTSINEKPLKKTFGKFGKKFIIMPDDEISYLFTVNSKISDALWNPNPVSYLCLDIKYRSSGSNKEHRYGFTALMTGGGGYVTEKTWDEKSFDEVGSILLDDELNEPQS